MFLKSIIFLHIISATIWTGGHLILAITVLPKALSFNDFKIIETFESKFEKIGLPALLILVLTGLYITYQYTPDIFLFNLNDHYTKHILLKFTLLFFTIGLALHAKFVLIPNRKLKPLAYHIILVTILSVLFVFVGFSARSGGII